ncbi:hypothetical protein H0H92_007499 [Tricholoma furcatifolium]|nr:hypothetical protein H0H92_007499 [Tricholoma furcatifolium]
MSVRRLYIQSLKVLMLLRPIILSIFASCLIYCAHLTLAHPLPAAHDVEDPPPALEARVKFNLANVKQVFKPKGAQGPIDFDPTKMIKIPEKPPVQVVAPAANPPPKPDYRKRPLPTPPQPDMKLVPVRKLEPNRRPEHWDFNQAEQKKWYKPWSS